MSFNFFKPRRPGHGGAFENVVKRAIAAARAKKFPSLDNSRNSGPKEEVRR